jgi:hypothetical protein
VVRQRGLPLHDLVDVGGDPVVGFGGVQESEPEIGEPRQDAALVGDPPLEDDVEGRQPVGGDHQEVVPQDKHLAHFPATDAGKRQFESGQRLGAHAAGGDGVTKQQE